MEEPVSTRLCGGGNDGECGTTVYWRHFANFLGFVMLIVLNNIKAANLEIALAKLSGDVNSVTQSRWKRIDRNAKALRLNTSFGCLDWLRSAPTI
jgi:hypothetical protein